jgi:lysozyme
MKTNEAGIALIKEFEGLRTTAYQDSVKIWTIGYGHTSAAGAPTVAKGMKITKEQAVQILRADLDKFEQAVSKIIKVPVSENAFAAMVSLAFNIGPGAFARSSVARFVNAKQIDKAARAFGMWVKAGGNTLPGLVRRRAAEAALFLTPDEGEALVATSNTIVEADTGKPALASTTNLATVATAAAGATGAIVPVVQNLAAIRDGLGISPATLSYVVLAIIVVGAAWVVYQRARKSWDYGV